MKSHENLVVFYKKSPTYNKQYWFSTPYKKNNGDEKQHSVYHDSYNVDTESADGKRNPLSIISFPRDGSRMHPTQKPVALCEYLIKTYTNDGDTVLDNCMGSGSTGVACINTNRNFVGIELNAEYFDIAKKRIEEANFYRW
jgi:site-specific DNA-methyltransferase (adenine-specific)